jgi:hypothetical protein
MKKYLALYVGETTEKCRLVAVSSDSDVIRRFIEGLAEEAVGTANFSYPILLERLD